MRSRRRQHAPVTRNPAKYYSEREARSYDPTLGHTDDYFKVLPGSTLYCLLD